ncbi:MAG: hypothetical protein R3F34_01570 [Planctomycetota bacterium]
MLPGHAEPRPDAFEFELQFAPLRAACERRGADLRAVVWDDPTFDPASFDAAVIGTTWDYARRLGEFLAALERTERATRLLNPLEVVRWNLDKRYLRDLEERGAPVVPTLWCESADAASIERGYARFGTEELVVKPVVGASAWRQARVRRGEPLPPPEELPPDAAMVQPFLPAASGRARSLRLLRSALAAPCGRCRPWATTASSRCSARAGTCMATEFEVAFAGSVLERVDADLLHARVDVVRGAEGRVARDGARARRALPLHRAGTWAGASVRRRAIHTLAVGAELTGLAAFR